MRLGIDLGGTKIEIVALADDSAGLLRPLLPEALAGEKVMAAAWVIVAAH